MKDPMTVLREQSEASLALLPDAPRVHVVAPPSVELPAAQLALRDQHPCVLLAMCVWGEARNQCDAAMVGVACVVRNRVQARRYGIGFAGVILRRCQFSSFNASDPNSAKLLTPTAQEPEAVWQRCFAAADAVFHNALEDTTGGAVFYFSPPLVAPPSAWGPVEHTVTIGELHFYRELTGASPVVTSESKTPGRYPSAL